MIETANRIRTERALVEYDDKRDVWIVDEKICSAQRFGSSIVANAVAQDHVESMKKLAPHCPWHVELLRPGLSSVCPTVLLQEGRAASDAGTGSLVTERISGSILTDSKGTPVGVLVFDHDGLEGTERIYSIDGVMLGKRSIGW